MDHHWFSSRDKRNVVYTCARKFTYGSLRSATNNFSDDMLLGEGCSGTVYKGVLPDGQVVEVKKYSRPELTDGETDFLQMVGVMSSQIRHRNIHQVIGFCMEGRHRLLVSEYVEHGSLSGILGDTERRKTVLDWHKRVAVCIGIARGITYLHEDCNPRAIHRGISSANILLDTNFTPKITDFDLIRFFCDSDELSCVDILAGTFGYLDPEYCTTCEYTDKSDVYAFGVVMLQIISGRKPVCTEVDFRDIHDRGIIHWVSRLKQSDKVLEVVDPMLRDFPADLVQQFIDVALLCTQRKGCLRPSMHAVVLMLQGTCNFWTPGLTMSDRPTSDYDIYSPTAMSYEDDGETNANFTEIAPDNAYEISEVQSQGDPDEIFAEGEGIETCTAREEREQAHIGTGSSQEQSNIVNVSEVAVLQQRQQQLWMKKKKPGIAPSGSGDLVERLSRTTVFKKNACPEAVYPPFHTRVFQRLGSRNLYSFDF